MFLSYCDKRSCFLSYHDKIPCCYHIMINMLMITSGGLGQDWMGSVQVHDLRPGQRHDPHQVWEKYKYRYKYVILEPENCTIPTKCVRNTNTNTTLTNTKLDIILGRRTAQIQSHTWKCMFDKYKQQIFFYRTPLSWLKITVFYLIYYTCLACFWIACLVIFFQVTW